MASSGQGLAPWQAHQPSEFLPLRLGWGGAQHKVRRVQEGSVGMASPFQSSDLWSSSGRAAACVLWPNGALADFMVGIQLQRLLQDVEGIGVGHCMLPETLAPAFHMRVHTQRTSMRSFLEGFRSEQSHSNFQVHCGCKSFRKPPLPTLLSTNLVFPASVIFPHRRASTSHVFAMPGTTLEISP